MEERSPSSSPEGESETEAVLAIGIRNWLKSPPLEAETEVDSSSELNKAGSFEFNHDLFESVAKSDDSLAESLAVC